MTARSFLHPEPPDTKIQPDLYRTRFLLDALQIDPTRFRVILITGTNGKGSTAYWCWEILKAHGIRAGLYTSPHLNLPNERIRLPDGPVPMKPFIETWNHVTRIALKAFDERHLTFMPTYFERMTVSAFVLFEHFGIQDLVLEVGLGGRWDATNVTEPHVSIITSIGIDHTEFLGRNIYAIAREKFGVARPHRPLLCGVSQRSLRRVLRRWSEREGVSFIDGYKISSNIVSTHLFGHFAIPDIPLLSPRSQLWLGLGGSCMQHNAILASLACQRFLEAQNRPFDPKLACDGLQKGDWPGRLEWIRMPNGALFLLDGAHNVPAIRHLIQYLKVQPWDRFRVLFASMSTKPWRTMLRILAPVTRNFYFVPVPGTVRGWAESEQHHCAMKWRAVRFTNYQEAVTRLMKSPELPIIVTGSFYLVGMVRKFLLRRGGISIRHPVIDMDGA